MARDKVSAMRNHDRGTLDIVDHLKRKIQEWEKRTGHSAKDEDIVELLLDLAIAEFEGSKSQGAKPSSWAVDVVMTDQERMLRLIRRYLPVQLDKQALEDQIQLILKESAEMNSIDNTQLIKHLVKRMQGRALPRDVASSIEQIQRSH